jgi:hypothetical protein
MASFRWFSAGVVAGLAAAAIGQELQKEPEERTWKGTVAGVPYNFRMNEWSEIANEYWNPDSDQILSPHAIGLGWGINFAALTRRAQTFIESQQQERQAHKIPEPSRR